MTTNMAEESNSAVDLLNLILGFVPSMAIKAVLQLGVPDIIARAGPEGSLSVDEIVARLHVTPKDVSNAAFQLERLLLVLVRKGVFRLSCVPSDGGSLRRVYSLTEMSNLLVSGNTVNIAKMTLHQVFMNPWHHLHEVVLDPANTPFNIANGKDVWSVCRENEEINLLFNNAMSAISRMEMTRVVQRYEGFKGVSAIVDVGGGDGTTLSLLRAAYPHIRCITFDLPQVIKSVPRYPGIEYVEGDMFHSIPSADAILIKRVLHVWGDDACINILRHCREALPPSGKVIIFDCVLQDVGNKSSGVTTGYIWNLSMMAHTNRGKERTSEEWKQLISEAGFTRSEIISLTPDFVIYAIEAHLSP